MLASVLFRVVAMLRLARPAPSTDALAIGSLQLLSMRGAHRVTVLAEHMGVSQPGMTQLVDRLAARGEVRRVSDAGDGRAVLVEITAAGEQRLAAELSDVGAVIAGLLTELDEPGRNRIVGALAELETAALVDTSLTIKRAVERHR